jgi:hypothetical protein
MQTFRSLSIAVLTIATQLFGGALVLQIAKPGANPEARAKNAILVACI